MGMRPPNSPATIAWSGKDHPAPDGLAGKELVGYEPWVAKLPTVIMERTFSQMPVYDEILVALRRITRAIDIQSKKLARVSGLTAPQLLVMQAIRKEGHAKPSSIAQDVLLSQATVTTIIDRLEKSDLVSRERSTTDRRVVFVSLTDDGQDRLRKAPELLQAGFIRQLDKLEDWERSLIVASLQRVASMMDAEEIEAAPILELGDLTEDGSGHGR